MATINPQGNISAACAQGCNGALAMYEWRTNGNALGTVQLAQGGQPPMEWKLLRCGGCGAGALAWVRAPTGDYTTSAAVGRLQLLDFYPEAASMKKLPDAVPAGLAAEFREAERCLAAKCTRAAAGMARSVLDKTLRANGYKVKKGTPLEQQIDAAANDGVITAARKKRAHDEVRVLGNDVLHEPWREIDPADVEASLHYVQRVLEDFYDDRPSVAALIKSLGKTTHEDDPSLLTSVAPD